jgi:tRNA U34 2-thiouridine synthase MnmA/TrmU
MNAIALISGGLDSILAAKVVKELGINVVPVNFRIPFCQREKSFKGSGGLASFIRNNLGAELVFLDISEEFLRLVLEPKHGFGSNMNPCIDCKILMLKEAKKLMASLDARFIITGEVLGQRPMSQHRRALATIAKESGVEGLLLRPLCAKLMEPTLPEKEGWVNRSGLYSMNGRSRKPQISLAKSLNIKDFPNASGGCLLTDKQFSIRLKDLIEHQALNIKNIELLKIGRHFRLNPAAKLIVGRNEKENIELENSVKDNEYLLVPMADQIGPACLVSGDLNEELLQLSCQIASRYSDLNQTKKAKYLCLKKDFRVMMEALPISEDKLAGLRL